MIIKNDVIYFKSVPEMFYKEQTGIKCNTVRFLRREEFILVHSQPPKKIHIAEKNEGGYMYKSFVREISDISYTKTPDLCIVIFSWIDYSQMDL